MFMLMYYNFYVHTLNNFNERHKTTVLCLCYCHNFYCLVHDINAKAKRTYIMLCARLHNCAKLLPIFMSKNLPCHSDTKTLHNNTILMLTHCNNIRSEINRQFHLILIK